jgi:hypothetical protein
MAQNKESISTLNSLIEGGAGYEPARTQLFVNHSSNKSLSLVTQRLSKALSSLAAWVIDI